jgi:hypothetical protein
MEVQVSPGAGCAGGDLSHINYKGLMMGEEEVVIQKV